MAGHLVSPSSVTRSRKCFSSSLDQRGLRPPRIFGAGALSATMAACGAVCCTDLRPLEDEPLGFGTNAAWGAASSKWSWPGAKPLSRPRVFRSFAPPSSFALPSSTTRNQPRCIFSNTMASRPPAVRTLIGPPGVNAGVGAASASSSSSSTLSAAAGLGGGASASSSAGGAAAAVSWLARREYVLSEPGNFTVHQAVFFSTTRHALPVALSMAPPPTRSPSRASSSSPRPRRRRRRAQDADVRVGEAHGLALAVVVEHPGVVLVQQLRDGAAVINTVAEAHGDAAAGRRQRGRGARARPSASSSAWAPARRGCGFQ